MAHQLRQRPGAGLIMVSYTAGALYDCLEAARATILSRPWKPQVDHEIISSNSPLAFCAALVKAIQE